ncbi:recombinase family protein [Phaeobacter sp. HS012]|uniref:recombinase family protein n=1 Tax=unclassified Phaeobacter TaxID=2621772 RepID=UPI001B381C10|nr:MULTISPECIES: recombinase family protein [unclassified Phaeobacter]MBQ4808094.1 recombinase family protein [Phaeobacter sp. HS012]MBQ4882943.1 recombinase family protein [Phaeobacter sp. HS011]
MQVGYARTSTADQVAGFEAQKRDLIQAGCEEVFSEQVSSVAQRAELENVLKFVRRRDTLVVTKLDRLARSTQHLLKIVDELEAKGVALRILDFGGAEVDTKSPSGKLMLTMFAAMAQFEREMMLERQREGIAKAKSAGRYKGRAPVPKTKIKQAIALKSEGATPPEIAKELSLGRSTVYRLLNKHTD